MASRIFAAPAAELRPPFCAPLRAGPVTLDFVDGDLRYLQAGGEELIRRITFNVRHHKWDTAEWQLDSFRLEQQPDSFFLHFSAACEIDGADYKWEADLSGEPDGTINYGVRGGALADTAEVRRAGLNVLYANDCVLGQPFETTHLDGQVVAHTFPPLVPTHHLPAVDFTKISHHTRGGALVTVEIDGSLFGLEDQRVAGDSSFKLFSGLRHTYTPVLARGDRAAQSITIRVRDVGTRASEPKTTAITLARNSAAQLPHLFAAQPQAHYGVFHELSRRPAAKNGIFLDVNLAKEKCRDATALTWGWYPNINLSDDEILMDNTSSIAGQVQTARTQLAPSARIRIDPISLDSIHPRATPRDRRNDAPFAAAWLVAAAKHLALGGAHEAAFALDGPFARAALTALAPHAGCAVRDAVITSTGAAPVAAFALATDSGSVVWLANLTAETQSFTVAGLAASGGVTLQRLHAATGPAFRTFPHGFADAQGRTRLTLAPHEVCIATVR